MVKPVRKAVFPVAGLGTRFLPATKSIPKEMLPLGDRPLIQHAVDEARAAGIEQFVFVTSRGKHALEDHFDLDRELVAVLRARGRTELLRLVEEAAIPPGRLTCVRQPEPLGLGHAVWCAREVIGNEPFAVLLPDEQVLHDRACLVQMMDAYRSVGGNLLSVFDVPREQTGRYGILDIGATNGALVEVRGMVEKPPPETAPSTLSIQGRYILQPEIFEHLGRFETGAGGEIQLTDAMARLLRSQAFHGFRFAGERFDCGERTGFLLANIAYGLRQPEVAEQAVALIRRYAKDARVEMTSEAAAVQGQGGS